MRSEPIRIPRAARVIGGVLGLVLLLAACWVVWRHRGDVATALHHTARAQWWLLAVALLLPVVSCVLSSTMYWFLLNRGPLRESPLVRDAAPGQPGERTPVAWAEMVAVIGSAWLINYLPARPGMVGRLAYHTVVNRIPLRFSIAMSLVAIACAGVAMGLLFLGALASSGMGAPAWMALAMPAVGLGSAAYVLRAREWPMRLALAALARYLDVLVWLARYLVAFAALGRPLSLSEGVAFTIVSQIAMLVPLVSNGLGIREWAIGLLGPVLPAWARTQGAMSQPTAMAGDLVNRAADVAAGVVFGGLCTLWVSRSVARARAVQSKATA